MSPLREFFVGPCRMGRGAPLFLIAGPCVIESQSHASNLAARIKELITGRKEADGWSV